MENRGLTVEQLARQKFRLRKALEAKIDAHRCTPATRAYNLLFFGTDTNSIEVSPKLCFSCDEDRYSPNWYYEGSFRFRKHYFRTIGELKSSGEEFECATFLDNRPEVKYWVRNLERRPDSSFWLQTASDRFYPDFVAMLTDGRILVCIRMCGRIPDKAIALTVVSKTRSDSLWCYQGGRSLSSW